MFGWVCSNAATRSSSNVLTSSARVHHSSVTASWEPVDPPPASPSLVPSPPPVHAAPTIARTATNPMSRCGFMRVPPLRSVLGCERPCRDLDPSTLCGTVPTRKALQLEQLLGGALP